MARELVQQGASLAICARDEKELERARGDLAQRGSEALAIPWDVTNKVEVDQMVQSISEHLALFPGLTTVLLS